MTQAVLCRGCKLYFPKDQCAHLGLGFVCSEACKQDAVRRRVESGYEANARRRARQETSNTAQRTLNGADLQLQSSGVRKRGKRAPGAPFEVRVAVRERDGHRCRRCGTTANLHVHHVRYRSEGGPNDPENLILLCEHCHATVHSTKGYWKPLLTQLLALQYDPTHPEFLSVGQLEGRIQRQLRDARPDNVS